MDKDIAIVGMAVKFPKAENTDKFWDNIINQVNCIDKPGAERRKNWDTLLKQFYKVDEITDEMLDYGGFLDSIDEFDGDVFGLSDKEILGMDSWQRLMTEMAFTALENAGLGGEALKDSDTGVFIGRDNAYVSSYGEISNYSREGVFNGTYPAMLASRISNILGLRGPSMVIDTSCSSALVALIQAGYSLFYGDCHTAIVGGINIRESYINADKKLNYNIMSNENKIYSFDRRAKGTLISEGAGAIVIRKYEDAVRDGNNILAVIKGWAINNTGDRSNLTVPNEQAQIEVIRRSWKNAAVSGNTIGYIEAHGTGTLVGDSIELNALAKAFPEAGTDRNLCAVSTVKSNIGHTVGASGIASIVKAILAMRKKKIPCNINFKELNPFVDLTDRSIYVNDQVKDWQESVYPRRCGINSFGFSGVNCHIVLEEARQPERNTDGSGQCRVFTLSAQTKYSFNSLIQKNLSYLGTSECTDDFESICYTSNVGRGHYAIRLAVIAENVTDLLNKLKGFNEKLNDPDIVSNVFVSDDSDQSADRQYLDECCDKLVGEFKENNRKQLEELCRLYVQGAHVEWKQLYRDSMPKLAELPVYPMDYKFVDYFSVIEEDKKAQGQYSQPMNHLQRVLLRIFNHVLMDKIGIYDNFFNCGGDSIKALQVITAIKKKKIQVALEDIYSYPTVAELSSQITVNEQKEDSAFSTRFGMLSSKDRELIPDDIEDAYPLTGLQAGMLFHSMWEKKSKAYANVLSIRIQFMLDQEIFKNALKQVVSIYPILRTVFDTVHFSEVLQLVKKEFEPVIVFHDYRDYEKKEADRKIEDLRDHEMEVGFHDFMNPPYRFDIIFCPEEQSHILFGFHHVLMDGWGVSTFLSKVLEIYKVMIDGEEIQLTEPRVSYRNFVEIERRTTQSDKCQAFWKQRLQKNISTPILKHDLSREQYDDINIFECHCPIDKESADNLQKVSEWLSIPIKNILFSIHLLALHELAGCSEIMTGIIMDGRLEEYDGDKVPGLYINTIPFYYEFNDSDLRNSMENMYESYKEILPHRRYPQYNMHKDLGYNVNLSSVFNYTDFYAYQGVDMFDSLNVLQDDMHENTLLPLYVKATKAKDKSITISYQINSNLFTKNEIDKLIQTYEKWIEKIAGLYEDRSAEKEKDSAMDEDEARVEQRIIAFLRDMLDVEDIDQTISFLELDVDSMGGMFLISKVNFEYELQLNSKDFYSCKNIRELARLICRKITGKTNQQKDEVREKDKLPLTYMQQSMWKTQNFNNLNTSYNIGLIIKVFGNLNVPALEESLNQIICQQEALRMAAHYDGENLYQTIEPYERYNIEFIKLDDTDKEVEKKTDEIIQREKARCFALDKPPLLHMVCIQKGAEEFQLLFTIHHYAFDFWSIGRFVEQLDDGYRQYLSNGKIEEKPLQVNYSDYILWDEKMNSDSAENERKMEYWRKMLEHADVPFQIYTDRESHSPYTELTAGRCGVLLEKEEVVRLKEIGLKKDASLFLVILTLYIQQLSELTRQDEIIIGVPSSNRMQYGFEKLIGCCMDTFVLKIDLKDAADFYKLLEHVREQYMMARVEYALPYSYIETRLDSTKRASKESIYKTIFNYVTRSNWNEAFSTVGKIEASMIPAQNPKFGLSADAIENDDGIWIEYEYAKELYQEQTMRDICSKFRINMENVINENNRIDETDIAESQEDFESLFDF